MFYCGLVFEYFDSKQSSYSMLGSLSPPHLTSPPLLPSLLFMLFFLVTLFPYHADILLGNVPNIYVYACNNPSESTLAKRRGYGTYSAAS